MKCLRCDNLFLDEQDGSNYLTCHCCFATWTYEAYINEKNGLVVKSKNDDNGTNETES